MDLAHVDLGSSFWNKQSTAINNVLVRGGVDTDDIKGSHCKRSSMGLDNPWIVKGNKKKVKMMT